MTQCTIIYIVVADIGCRPIHTNTIQEEIMKASHLKDYIRIIEKALDQKGSPILMDDESRDS